MKKLVILLLAVFSFTVSCKKRVPLPEPDETLTGHVKFTLNGQVIYDEDLDDVSFITARSFAGFNFSGQNGVVRLGGGITNVPAIGGTNTIFDSYSNSSTDCSQTNLSCVEIASDTGEYQAPDGRILHVLVGKSGTVIHPEKYKVIGEGELYEMSDPLNPVVYQFRLELTINPGKYL